MSIWANEEQKQLLRTSRTGIGLLDALFAEHYCNASAAYIELIHKLSISLTALLSTGAAVSLFQLLLPKVAPHLAVASALVSVLGTTFAWRSQALAFAKASRAYGDLAVRWSDLWYVLRETGAEDAKRMSELELEANKIGEIVSPHTMNKRRARACQREIRKREGL